MRLIAFINDPLTVLDILSHLGNAAGRATGRSWPSAVGRCQGCSDAIRLAKLGYSYVTPE
jgi:hypothetical protein